MNRIGILGGTFNPPHNGHLLMAELVRESMKLDEIWLLPASVPPHKQETSTSAVLRAEMAQLAAGTNEYFSVQNIELKRTGVSYTFDTIKILKERYPENDFYFIIGADMIAYLPKWHRIEELSRLIQFVGVNRTGYKVESKYPVHLVDIPAIDLSSTAIRARIRKRQTVKYMLPDTLIHFIKEHQLYED